MKVKRKSHRLKKPSMEQRVHLLETIKDGISNDQHRVNLGAQNRLNELEEWIRNTVKMVDGACKRVERLEGIVNSLAITGKAPGLSLPDHECIHRATEMRLPAVRELLRFVDEAKHALDIVAERLRS